MLSELQRAWSELQGCDSTNQGGILIPGICLNWLRPVFFNSSSSEVTQVPPLFAHHFQCLGAAVAMSGFSSPLTGEGGEGEGEGEGERPAVRSLQGDQYSSHSGGGTYRRRGWGGSINLKKSNSLNSEDLVNAIVNARRYRLGAKLISPMATPVVTSRRLGTDATGTAHRAAFGSARVSPTSADAGTSLIAPNLHRSLTLA